VHGEVKVSVHTEQPERFGWLERVYLSRDVDDDHPRAVAVEGVRYDRKDVLLKLVGYDSREQAQLLREQWVRVPLSEALPLEEGEYYLFQLIGLDVYSDAGEHLGNLVDIIETGANDVFVVQGPRGEILLPDIPDVVRSIDFDARRVTVTLLPGLL
jgi:16S rRNA processing protein RimM